MNWLSWQIDYLLFLQNFREISNHVFDSFFLMITTFGEVYIPLIFICSLYWCVNKKYGIYLFWSYLFGFISNTFLKTTACIYRPWILDSRIKPLADAIPAATGYSFPSGHTASCTTTWGGAAILFWKNKYIRYMFLSIIILVMISRNYLGVHTPQDVLVSFIISITIILFNKKLLEWEEKESNRDLIILGIITLINFMLIIYVQFKNYPMECLNGKLLYDTTGMKSEIFSRTGFVFGAFYGWFLEKRLVNFRAQSGTIFEKILRAVFGIIILIFINNTVKTCLINSLGDRTGLFITYTISSLFITFIYPFVIKVTKPINK